MAKRIRKYRIRKPLPFEVDGKLRDVSMGITIGEASPYCSEGYKKLVLEMCDKKAVEMVAKAWGTGMWKERYKEPRCPRTLENPEGGTYNTASGETRGEMIMKGYEPEIINTNIHKRWKNLKCKLKKTK